MYLLLLATQLFGIYHHQPCCEIFTLGRSFLRYGFRVSFALTNFTCTGLIVVLIDTQEVEKIASAYDETTRRVERGARIVVAIQDAPKLVLQVS